MPEFAGNAGSAALPAVLMGKTVPCLSHGHARVVDAENDFVTIDFRFSHI